MDVQRTCSASPIAFTGEYDGDNITLGRYSIRPASGAHFRFKGKLDEVMLFDQALSPAHVGRLYDEVAVTLVAPSDAENVQAATAHASADREAR